ncbi:type II toxin-antitoxin system PemI/MazE family antitoxin [Levilactobacillus yiduensis]|uniref:type II toxin-antitoxin system PemI/MazE family antitoxin n=1 Tax=Levilactobacillus yiduensis TaxID=2953880 RepID=UPI001ADDC505|nr:AbrB family transcriptional regulator [Levilactobacillus yiduensis]
MTVKVQKQGETLIVALPASLQVEANAEFDVIQETNGIISFVPVQQNIFAQHPDDDLRADIAAMNLGDNGRAVGKENVWKV